ncbi:PQQ-binding-like beta-propeller repeat protein [Paenibacillus piri]|nr:PQQ-binding-like beta-propeller repeat protein [Paenibacillus piri]
MTTRGHQPLQVAGYSQGGTVVEGVAYFTANSFQEHLNEEGHLTRIEKPLKYPYVVAFDTGTLEVIRTYDFEDTYDSSPLVLPKKDGTWLVLAHEHINQRTVAMNRDTGEIAWISEANQPGSMFFGYSYYVKKDGTTLILANVQNGLHAISLEDGKEAWFIPGTGGVTPCVDQAGGHIYCQWSGRLSKINAETGAVIQTVAVEEPSSCVSWNTVLAHDEHGYHIITYWYSPRLYGSAIRVYDAGLTLLWEKSGLSLSKKATLAYHGGSVFVGSGDHWQSYYSEPNTDWKNITAYRVNNGEIAWKLDLSGYHYSNIPNIVYCNGMLIAETQTNIRPLGYHLLVMDALNGALLKSYYKELPANSCAVPLLTGGKWFSGDLVTNSVLVTELGTGGPADWIGAYGNGQTNDMCVDSKALTALK